ncbi:MAG: DUF58 domain-containing protein [Acidimicrobiia bacterium]|nr:DUF58 domain-containing protein [Acidimicrobiia bacterium]
MLTASGRGAALVGGLLLVGGWVAGWPAAVVPGVAAVAALALAALFLRSKPSIEVRRTLTPSRVTVGESATGQLEITNPDERTSIRQIAHERFGDHELDVVIPRLAAGETLRTTYDLPTWRRAVLAVGPLQVRRGDPFGLVRSDRSYGGSDLLFVHPRRVAVPPLPSNLLRSLEGPTAETAPQGTITFHTLREYVRGDDLRHIHWRTTARTGTLMVRQLVDVSYPELTVLLDDRAERYPDPAVFETAVEVAASIVQACRAATFPVHLWSTTHGGALLGRHSEHLTAELDVLAGIQPQPGSPGAFTATVERAAREAAGTAAVVVTGPLDADELPRAATLQRRFPVVVYLGCEATGASAPPMPTVAGVRAASVVDLDDFAAIWSSGALS